MTRSPESVYDELLIMRCQDGDRAAMTELVKRWQPRLLRRAFQLTGRTEAAWDVLQESWMAIVRGLNRLDDPASFPKWALRIVANKSADWTRRQQRGRKLLDEASRNGAARVAVATDNQADDESGRLRRALRRLPSDRRDILSMFYSDSLSIVEIADVLSIPAGTVKSRLFHARSELKTLMETKGEEND